MLNRLRQHLSSITAEQFQSEWAEIQSMGFGGISVEDFLKIFPPYSNNISINPADSFASDLNGLYEVTTVVEYSFAMAA